MHRELVFGVSLLMKCYEIAIEKHLVLYDLDKLDRSLSLDLMTI